RDPLLEYKREAFQLFETLLDEVREEALRRIFRVQLEGASPPPVRERAPVRMMATHAEAPTAFGGAAPQGEPQESGAPATASQGGPKGQAGRGVLRAGRNDPCPCGSGKKYKKCHLPIDEGQAA